MSYQKVIILGHLGRAPELRVTQQQTQVCSFSVCTNERVKKDGAYVDVPQWHSIVTFGKLAENCKLYLAKGSQAFIEGRLNTRKWQDKQGNDRYTTEIIAAKVDFVGSKKEGAEAAAQESAEPAQAEQPAENSFSDDDIPF